MPPWVFVIVPSWQLLMTVQQCGDTAWCLLILAFILLWRAHYGVRGKPPVDISRFERTYLKPYKLIYQRDWMLWFRRAQRINKGSFCADVYLAILKTQICHSATASWQSLDWEMTERGGDAMCSLEYSSAGNAAASCHFSLSTNVQISKFHNAPPTPNNNIAITVNHIILTEPPWGKVLELKCLYIYVHITMSWWQREHIFSLNLSSIEKKNAAIHKCFTSGSYWENYAVNSRVPGEVAESHFFLVYAGQCLDGRGGKTAQEWENRKPIFETRLKKRLMFRIHFCAGWQQQMKEKRNN